MSDYISREAAIDRLNKNLSNCNPGTFSEMCYADAIETVKHLPSADVEPVRHGKWIEDHDYLKCPECGVMVKRDFTFFDVGDWNFCPNCGAKMEGGAENATD